MFNFIKKVGGERWDEQTSEVSHHLDMPLSTRLAEGRRRRLKYHLTFI
jgi:hypothetical protein